MVGPIPNIVQFGKVVNIFPYEKANRTLHLPHSFLTQRNLPNLTVEEYNVLNVSTTIIVNSKFIFKN